MQAYLNKLWPQVREAMRRAAEWIVQAHARQAELCLGFQPECDPPFG